MMSLPLSLSLSLFPPSLLHCSLWVPSNYTFRKLIIVTMVDDTYLPTTAVLKLLVDNSADMTILDKQGKTPEDIMLGGVSDTDGASASDGGLSTQLHSGLRLDVNDVEE
mmetsp:Transcript_15968/g.25556  ORF Transcript_15968/g.25556 Transcript_15968/m.25556 type:complete len:109 (+) Transcript_15968:1956-2282(+)